MSRVLGKASQKVKKKAGRLLDRLRPSREDKSTSTTSPAPSIPHGFSTSSTLVLAESTVVITHSSIAPPLNPTSTPANPSDVLTGFNGLESPGQSPKYTSPVVPAYAQAPSQSSVLATTGSVTKELLAAVRDGSDLFLPLKAALTGVVKLWDIWDVSWLNEIRLHLLILGLAHC